MIYKVTCPNTIIKGSLKVPASKSISNRLLIIQAICNQPFTIDNISDSEDTRVLVQALSQTNETVDIGHAGTSMRFLTALFSNTPGQRILTGSARMQERPIGNLVTALRTLGASIDYVEKEGFPPLRINGKQLTGGKVSIDGSVSSQFISALLLSAPTFKKGLELELENNVISSSYIDMTLKMMKHAGVEVVRNKRSLFVEPQQYHPKDIVVEGDWSGVSYWYEMVALASDAEISIASLGKNSVQGDASCANIFEHLNVKTEYLADGIRISKTGSLPKRFNFDFIENPDLVQTLAVTCVMLHIPFRFTGTQSLRIKETDRILALQNELVKFGAALRYDNGTLTWDGVLAPVNDENVVVKTYHDHRMALAFAPVALVKPAVCIDDPNVVVKSYPEYWNDLQRIGFTVAVVQG